MEYFLCSFLFYVTVACGYGAALTFPDFSTVAGLRSFAAFRGPRPTSRAHTAVMFTFVLSISVGIAVMLLFSWHLYLVLTAQTTIGVLWKLHIAPSRVCEAMTFVTLIIAATPRIGNIYLAPCAL